MFRRNQLHPASRHDTVLNWMRGRQIPLLRQYLLPTNPYAVTLTSESFPVMYDRLKWSEKRPVYSLAVVSKRTIQLCLLTYGRYKSWFCNERKYNGRVYLATQDATGTVTWALNLLQARCSHPSRLLRVISNPARDLNSLPINLLKYW
jgi:hypothetical protein